MKIVIKVALIALVFLQAPTSFSQSNRVSEAEPELKELQSFLDLAQTLIEFTIKDQNDRSLLVLTEPNRIHFHIHPWIDLENSDSEKRDEVNNNDDPIEQLIIPRRVVFVVVTKRKGNIYNYDFIKNKDGSIFFDEAYLRALKQAYLQESKSKHNGILNKVENLFFMQSTSGSYESNVSNVLLSILKALTEDQHYHYSLPSQTDFEGFVYVLKNIFSKKVTIDQIKLKKYQSKISREIEKKFGDILNQLPKIDPKEEKPKSIEEISPRHLKII